MTSEQKTETIQIPTSCNECYNSDFKLPRPNCWYEKALELQKAVNYFKNKLDMDLNIPVVETLANIEPLAKQCLSDIPNRAHLVIEQKKFEKMENTIISLQADIRDIKNFQQNISNVPDTHIFKDEQTMNTPVEEVKKPDIKPVTNFTPASNVETSEEPVPMGGWLKYRRNIKKENIPKFLKELAKAHPELKKSVDLVLQNKPSKCVKISINKNKNFIIERREIRKKRN